MLEITPDDIACLNDEDLRTVVARLCEAECRARGHSAAYVTWGGHQDAADGGIDVRVSLPPACAIDGFVPRQATGFQVKAQDMPPAEIGIEMRPKGGDIRPAIQGLADQSGAYIIVSSQGSTTDPALASRRAAMREAVAEIRNGDALTLDFYDRTRLATWVRSHEGLIPLVRALAGRGLQGWQSYGPWAAPVSATAEYLFDDELRVHRLPMRETDKGLSALQGIQEIRAELLQPRQVVRLVGLSGVGKTRLLQALFDDRDDRIGDQSLDPSLAIYTNMADSPDPRPIEIATNLVTAGTRMTLVIDNCPPDLHQRLSEICRQSQSHVSVITVEYDIREDQPEGTEVFKLESSSPDLIERLLRQRFPAISQIDAHTVAAFSGGNARVAIALASTIGRNETVAGLTDDQLFQRLFFQRYAPDESLYLAGQACALVYSFEGEDISEGDSAELVRLGRLVGRTPQELYRSVAELQRRDLVQQRSVWRAILPHAIANRLATAALQNISYAEIERHLLSSERLFRSFSRRLCYLHSSKEAVAIVKKWLGDGGLLENVAGFNDLGRAVFDNVAPVAPEDTLAALERALAFSPENAGQAKDYCELLRSLAYDPALFKRCADLMTKILTSEEVRTHTHGTRLFTSLFSLVLSGTHATIEQRMTVTESLLASSDERRRALGILALKAALEALHFNSGSNFEFGARPRDFGYRPRSKGEVQHWFAVSLKVAENFACGDGPVASRVGISLAEAFRGLWLGAGCPDALVEVCKVIRKSRFWPEGWLAVRQTMDLDGKSLGEECLSKLLAIELVLRPTDLAQKVRAVVFSTRLQGVDLDDFEDHSSEDIATRIARTEALAQNLGKAVAAEETILTELLPEIVTIDGRLWSFGRGLLEGTAAVEGTWNRLIAALAKADQSTPRPQVLAGYLQQLRTTNRPLAATLLDAAVEDSTLARWYPYLQVWGEIEEADLSRLKRSLAIGMAPADAYLCLAYGGTPDPIASSELAELIMQIAEMPSGYHVALEILHMRLHSDEQRKKEIAAELIYAGGELMSRLTFTGRNDREDYRLGGVVKACLKGAKGAAVATAICHRLKDAIASHETSAIYHDDVLVGLFIVQPVATLEGLCGGDAKELKHGVRILENVDGRIHPLAVVSEDDLLAWCDREPEARYSAFASVIPISRRDGDNIRWTSLALRFLEKAPDQGAILRQFTSELLVSGGMGSLAAMSEKNATLLDQLECHPHLSDIIAEQKQQLNKWIEDQRGREAAWSRRQNERFE